jgi:GNAT superfamily N-acetyltransferase
MMTQVVLFQIVKKSDPLFTLIEEAFDSRISALYDHRCSTLQKLQRLDDRYCEIMFVNHQPAGFIIYKKALQQEFGLKNAFELKTLFVFDPEKYTRRGLGSLLFDRAAALAQEKQAAYTYSTVVEDNVAMVACAIKNGFHVELYGRILTKKQRKYYPLEENEVLIIKYGEPSLFTKGEVQL